MACFIESIVVAAAVSGVKKSVEKREKSSHPSNKISWSRKLGWYIYMLLGGSFLLAFEHAWHGEIVPYPPFLTAAATKEGFYTMLEEIALVGTLQVVLITAIWGVMVYFADKLARHNSELVGGVKCAF